MAAGRKQSALFILLAAFFVVLPAFAQNATEESLTINTYYPSPYGVYRDLGVERSIKHHPQALLPDNAESSEGEMAYLHNSTDQGFYYFNGAQWKASSGGSYSGAGWVMIARSCPWGSDYRAGANSGWGNQCNMTTDNCCVPPSCPANWTEIGKEAVLTKAACNQPSAPCYWNGTTNSTHPVAIGRVIRYCAKDCS